MWLLLLLLLPVCATAGLANLRHLDLKGCDCLSGAGLAHLAGAARGE